MAAVAVWRWQQAESKSWNAVASACRSQWPSPLVEVEAQLLSLPAPLLPAVAVVELRQALRAYHVLAVVEAALQQKQQR